ncbi:hypothetical protein KCP76_01240 [Salmonella enterica subsp. enterica serovar Weltevreden]|nr:hypothetical protein KCP76_01240 [Salmonella enterica subsp. enterica serovar Weltevreden]
MDVSNSLRSFRKCAGARSSKQQGTTDQPAKAPDVTGCLQYRYPLMTLRQAFASFTGSISSAR